MSEEMNRYLDVANQMQQGMEQAEDQLRNSIYTGQADGVEIKINGKYLVEQVSIDDAIHQADKATLEQQLTDAFNNAVQQIELATRNQIAKLAKSLDFPTDQSK